MSNINEGLSNALQCFDDLDTIRENQNGKNISKHCILVCNSSAFPLPTSESVSYNGLLTDQLISLFNERNIHLSIFSPRKIPFLFKLFEKANGDLKTIFTKNYAKDARHLILLKDFQLQEHPQQIAQNLMGKTSQPISVTTNQPNGQQNNSSTNDDVKPVLAGSVKQQISVKRPLSPAANNGPPQSIQALQNPNAPNQPIRPNLIAPNQTFNNLANAKQDISVMKINQNNARGASPVSRPNWNQTPNNQAQQQQQNSVASPGNLNNSNNTNVPTPQQLNSSSPNPNQQQQQPQMSALANQLNSTMRSNTPNMQSQNLTPNVQIQQTNPNAMINQQQLGPGIRPQIINQQQQQIRPPINVNNGTINNSNFNNQPPQNQMYIQNRASPHPQTVQQGMQQQQQQQGMQTGQQQPQMNQAQINQSKMNQNMMNNNGNMQQIQNKPGNMMQQQQQQQQQGMQQQQVRSTIPRQLSLIWEGSLEFRVTGQQQFCKIGCKISSTVINPATNETECQAIDWPPKMQLQFTLKHIISRNINLLKDNSVQITIQLDKEKQPDEYQKLTSQFQQQQAGGLICLNNARLRLILVFFVPGKQMMTGIIPNDQETFLNAIKEDQAKHKRVKTVFLFKSISNHLITNF